ncbi:MAG TPA: hypothetical protein DIT05_14295 [Morganella sp. (in: Bacteria)]|nr:hypothetical protein [Morganella sp. (in: enterobacteria)]
MAQFSTFAPVPIGAGCCCNDDYGAKCSRTALPTPSFFTAYRQMRSLPGNTPSDSSISMIVGVTGGFAHVR